MIAAAPKFRTFMDAMAESKPLMGEGASFMGAMERSPSIMNRLQNGMRPLVAPADALIDAAAINASLPDDTAQRTTRKIGGRIANRLDPDAQLNALKNGFGPDDAGLLNGVRKPVPGKPVVRPVEPKPGALDTGMEYVGKGTEVAGAVMMADALVLPAVGGAAGWMGMKGVQNTLGAPGRLLGKEITPGLTGRQALGDGLQIGVSALQSYSTAKGFFQNLNSLKEMYADVMGVDARSVSTMALLTGKVPPVLTEARSHFLKEFGSRGLIQAAGWGLMARDLMRGKLKPADEIASGRIGWKAGIIPSLVSMGVDALMGTSTIEVYSGFKKAFESGEVIPPGAYAQFILASSADLQKRKVGRQVAMELGVEYAKDKTAPGEILRQMNDGRFKVRIDRMIATDEAALAAHQKAHPHQGKHANAAVDKMNGNKQQPGKVVGPFTDRLHKESSMQNKELH